MSEKKDYDGALVFFLIGLVIVSLTVGTMAEHSGYGWAVLGGGLMSIALVSAILTYLQPSTTFQDVDKRRREGND